MFTLLTNNDHLCDYGCNQTAHYINDIGKYCCSDSCNKCPAIIKKNRMKAILNHQSGIYKSEEYKKKLSESAIQYYKNHDSPRKKIKKPIIKLCEICSKEHDSSYGSGRYCSSVCAHKASTLHTDKVATYKKVSQTLRARSKQDIINSSIKALETYNKNHPKQNKHPFPKNNICKCCGKPYHYKKCCDNPKICQFILRSKPQILKLFGFNFSKLGSNDIYKEYDKVKEILIDEYIHQKMAVAEIAEKRNSDEIYLIWCLLKRMGIPTRDVKESNINALLKGRMKEPTLMSSGYQYKCGWHTTWNNHQIYYRSSYELDFAKYLDSQKIVYECETIRLPYFNNRLNKIKIAVSDFYIPATNTLYQIKSSWTYVKKDAIDRYETFTQNGYNVILIYEHQEYNNPSKYPEESKQNISSLV